MADEEICFIYTDDQRRAIEVQMDAYILAREELTAASKCAEQSKWVCAKKRAVVIMRRTLELQELEAEQAAGLNRKELINMTKNVIATLKECY
jgi:hypothetical protein